MKRFLISAFLCLVVVGIGAAVVVGVWAAKSNRPEIGDFTERTAPPVEVHVIRPTTLQDELYLTGVADAWLAVTLSAETIGRIERQDIDEGESVGEAKELIRINTTALRAQYDQDKARHELARQEYDRLVKMQQGGISSPQEYDRAVSEEKSAKSRMRLTEIDLERSVIKAPINGVVDKVFQEPGEYVIAGTPLVRVVQVDRIKILLGIPERDVNHFEEGDPVALTFDAVPKKSFTGKIHRIATTAEATTRTFVTEIAVDNQDGLLRPGMIARLALVRETYENAISIPLFAVMKRNDQAYVFLEKEESAVLHPVELGFHRGGMIHVISGLQEGDKLIAAGQRDLQDGDAVRVSRGMDALL